MGGYKPAGFVPRIRRAARRRVYTARLLAHYKRAAFRMPRAGALAFGPGPVPTYPYVMWKVCHLLGLEMQPITGDGVAFAWHDVTETEPRPGAINGRCSDIRKTRVGEAQLRHFGYCCEIDPRTYVGPAVRKSELNTAHDGCIVQCPLEPEEGYVYQRLIDSEGDDGFVEELRIPIVGSRIPQVYILRRPSNLRFAIMNSSASLKDPSDVMSLDEIGRVVAVAREVGLEMGEVDVLRDRSDGRIYVIDVNKTPFGPPRALPWSEALEAARMLSAAFSAEFLTAT
jgi:hypothetical protein